MQTNTIQGLQGRNAGYVPFALCETAEAADAACVAMRQLQTLFQEARK